MIQPVKPIITCPTRCNCGTVYRPVCGKSGNTHGNSCLANCFKDPVAKVGECAPKCLKDTIVKKQSCKVEPYGRTGTRNYCCKWREVNGIKRNEMCNYKGPATYVYEKSACKWKKLSPTTKQLECCTWTRTRVGKHVKDTKRVCKQNGPVIQISRKIGCRNRPFGKFGMRKFCCSHKTRCVGKSCRITHRRCSYTGPIFTERRIRRCKWARKTQNLRQVRCCHFTQNCRINQKTKQRKCLKRAKKCVWVGKTIVSVRIRRCTIKPFGRRGTRNHCCSYTKRCKGKRCRHVNIRCSWQGCARYEKLKYSCSFVHVRKNTIRKQCCKWRQVTSCKNKKLSNRRCRFVGKPITTKTKRGCKWSQNGRNSRKLVCCKFHKQCSGKKCHRSKKCVLKKVINTKSITKCSWKKFGKFSKRRNCCSVTKRCFKNLKRVIKKRKIIKKKKIARRSVLNCALYADPHVSSNGRFFEAQTVGDWNLYKGYRLTVSYRGVRMGRWVAAVKFAVKLYGDVIYSDNLRFDQLTINGKVTKITNGKTQISPKGTLIKNGNKLTFSTNKGEEVDFITFGSFFNAYVRSNVRDSTGICSQQFHKSHAFKHFKPSKIITIKSRKCPNRKLFTRECKLKKLSKGALRNCVMDLCNGLDRKIERKIIRINKREKKIFKIRRNRPGRRTVTPIRRTVTPVRRTVTPVRRTVTRPTIRVRVIPARRFVPRPPAPGRVFRRRGRGDVWLQTKGGKWVDVNVVGTFNYLRDRKIGLKIDVQFNKVKRGSVIGSIAIRARNNLIVAQRNGVVKLNGKVVPKSSVFDFRKNLRVFRLKKHREYEIVGLRKERISFKYERETNSYMLSVGSIAKHHIGLYADPRHSRKYQIKSKVSVFPRFIKYRKLRKYKPTKLEKLQAKKCCKKYRGIKRKECKSDFYRTDTCLHYLSDKAPKLHMKIHRVRGMRCKLSRKRCRFVGRTIYIKSKRSCRWKKHGKFSKRRFCCKLKKRCVGKKCNRTRKCKYVGKIVRITVRKSCSIQTYGNKSSRRRLCCTWRNYCTGLKKKFKCRPVQKRCKWTGKIHQRMEKYVCKWERKTRKQKQRYCCRWFRSCVSNQNGKQRNCTNGAKKCSWVGHIIKKSVRRLCNFRRVGKYGRRKYCCNHFKKCKNTSCQVKRRGCKFQGPIYSRTPSSNCKWKMLNKKQKRRRCCYWNNYCINKKCSASKKHCKFVGMIVTTSSFRKCYWKQVQVNGKYGRRRECCKFRRVTGSKGTKITKKSCVFIGKTVLLENTYYKRDTKCTTVEDRKTCCKRIHKCQIKDAKHSCSFYKNERCVVKIVEIKTPKNPAVCVSSGDPHYSTFKGKRFDYYRTGDFLLLESRSFTVHTRLRQWGTVSVNTGFAAKVNKVGETVQTETRDGSDFLINGKDNIKLALNQRYFFRYGGYIHRTSNNLIKVVSASGDYMDVQVYPFNNRGNKQYQSHYMNIVVKVANRKRYLSGFCVNPTPQHVKGLFNSEFNPKVESKPLKKCSVEKRRKIRRQCKKAGITSKRGLFRCIIDVCYKMKPIEERAREILKDEEKLKPTPKPVVVNPEPVAKKEGICYSLGDPHYTTFDKKNFDNYFIGDWVLVRSKGFTVHARTRKWGNASVNKRIAAKLNGDLVEAKSASKFILNRDTEVDLKVGQKIKLPKGGVVTRVSNTRVYYYSFKAGYLDADFIGTDKNRYVNLIVKVPNYPATTGACQGKMIEGHKLFRNELKMKKRSKELKVSKECHDKARLRCKNRGVSRRFRGSCIIDVCSGLGTKGIRSGRRHVKVDKIKVGTPIPRPAPRVVPRPAPRVVVPRPRPPIFVPRRFGGRAAPVVRRRARGDVWMKTRGGKWIDVNKVGTFKYLEDAKIGLNIEVQFTQMGQGSVLSAIAFKVRGKKIVADKNGNVSVNGNRVTFKSAIFDFSHNEFNVYNVEGHTGLFELRGLRKDRLSFQYEKDSQSYMVSVGSIEKHHVGLYIDPEHPRLHLVNVNDNIFPTFVAYRSLKTVPPTKEQIAQANACCGSLTNEERKQECMINIERTGKCLSYYTQKNPSLQDN